MGAFDWFWKAMGAQSERNDDRSKRVVDGADRRTAQLHDLDDASLAARARELAAEGEISDRAEFLAILSVASTRTLEMTPFHVQSQAVLRLLEGPPTFSKTSRL